MKKKLVLKPFVLPTLYLIVILLLMIYTINSLYKDEPVKDENLDMVSEQTLDETVPVVKEEDIYVLNPYSGENINETVGYYDYKGEKEAQEKSIIKFENTYLQNTGITYSSEKDFKVIAIMDGKVTKIYENELLGNIVEITHDKEIVSVYQMVKDVKVKVGDEVKSGDEIATSGTSKLNPTLSNLHFEILKSGQVQDPKKIVGTNIKEL